MERLRVTRVKDLTDQIGTPYPRPLLKCSVCQGEYSANRGDYFMAHPDTVMMCCDEPMALVVKRTVYAEVSR